MASFSRLIPVMKSGKSVKLFLLTPHCAALLHKGFWVRAAPHYVLALQKGFPMISPHGGARPRPDRLISGGGAREHHLLQTYCRKLAWRCWWHIVIIIDDGVLLFLVLVIVVVVGVIHVRLIDRDVHVPLFLVGVVVVVIIHVSLVGRDYLGGVGV